MLNHGPVVVHEDWRRRAAEAEDAITRRHLGPLVMVPMTRLGRTGWPPTWRQRLHQRPWHYWWQAHLLDCLVDAQQRDPRPERARTIHNLVRGIFLRNGLKWTNNYYDDMAWLGLALERAGAVIGMDVRRPLAAISAQLDGAWTDDAGGGIWWRRKDDFKNTPANGPAAILQARIGERDRARETAQWLTDRLVDPETGLVWDGLRVRRDTGEVYDVVKRIYTYCPGVYLGACVELWKADGAPEWVERAERTITAVRTGLTTNGVLRGHGAGDGGLFSGVLARYLALAARELPATAVVSTARDIVLASARACWANKLRVDEPPLPLFGTEWGKPAGLPSTDPRSRHLSPQLGGWMLLEAAAAVTAPNPRAATRPTARRPPVRPPADS